MRLALAVLCLALAGCYGTQIYPTLQEQRISLSPGDLEAGGVAFITPSTVTGQEPQSIFIFQMIMEKILSMHRSFRQQPNGKDGH